MNNYETPVTPGSLNFALYSRRIGIGLLNADDALTQVLEVLDSTEPESPAVRLCELLRITRNAAASGFERADAEAMEALAGQVRETLLDLASQVYGLRATATEMKTHG
jgi:hypothetical protein